MIRKVGIASMVALPIVSSIVAPPATNAQSGGYAGTCIQVGQNFCAGCGGVTGLFYTSTDGSHRYF